MARIKRSSATVEKATQRASALSSINASLDLGNGLTLGDYTDSIASLKAKMDVYNATLSLADGQLNTLGDGEKALADLSDRMLGGVASKFGKNSNEYEMAGGVRKSDRKRPVRKAKTPAA